MKGRRLLDWDVARPAALENLVDEGLARWNIGGKSTP
jgi:hypothetical protein